MSVTISRCLFRSSFQTLITWSYGSRPLEKGKHGLAWDQALHFTACEASRDRTSALHPRSSFRVPLACDFSRLAYTLAKHNPDCSLEFERLSICRVILPISFLYLYWAGNVLRCFRICTIRSVDGSSITSYCVHECDASSRMGSRPRRFLITGHTNGSVQVRVA